MAKRGLNVYRRKDGRWEGRYIKGRKKNGKPQFGYVYTYEKEVCERIVQSKRLQVQAHLIEHGLEHSRLGDYLDFWLGSIASITARASTRGVYRGRIEKWIKPYFGNRDISLITKEEVQAFIGFLSAEGLSAGTIRNIYQTLNSALAFAVKFGYRATNPCKDCIIANYSLPEARCLSHTEQMKLEEVARGHTHGIAVLLSLYTGLRIGEVCALKWNDIDEKEGVLTVARTRQRIKNLDQISPTQTILVEHDAKTHLSKRRIPLPACIRKALQEHKKHARGEYVLNTRGHCLEPRVLQYRFKSFLRKARLKNASFHVLRHTFATQSLELGMDIVTLSGIMGHASSKMTLDCYGHSRLDHKRKAMGLFDRAHARTCTAH